ncbi:MAG: aldo/keto reductase [Acidobacteria bacterium]|nr:aldo/keto reductase [Acidobacteriota bacterium]
MHRGFATPEGTARFASRFPAHLSNGFFRQVRDLTLSSLGIGTYLGAMDDATDTGYRQSVAAAVEGGINFIDTSLNYRHQRSERAIGKALEGALREEVILCTKAGYLVPDAIPAGVLGKSDVVAGIHSMAPAFLEDQLARSLANLGVNAIDVFYLHNPETQIPCVGPEAFCQRVTAAFEACERLAVAGKILYYGAATWDGFRQNGSPEGLSLVRLAGIARSIAGERHRFRFIQLPFNLTMTEAYGQRGERLGERRMSVLEAAGEMGITVIASASILQSRLAADAGRAIQFARSAPGISVALVGMSKQEHVRQNLQIAQNPALNAERFDALFSP